MRTNTSVTRPRRSVEQKPELHTGHATRARIGTSLPWISTLAAALALHLPPALPAAAQVAESAGSRDRDVARIRSATAAFKSLDRAVAAGYDRDVVQCVRHPQLGTMGYHHQNNALLDRRIELEHPEMLVYERLPDGAYRLNGVEYIVPFSVWPQSDPPPVAMGQKLKPAPSLSLWYLHVWVWLENPSGLFADWHPEVRCPA
ncbi:MAG: hypothetical protein L0271_13380 [Gemmatimonadetes bacterium]|nr:hypothetical protein [Gemmatimonadota bacterium]